MRHSLHCERGAKILIAGSLSRNYNNNGHRRTKTKRGTSRRKQSGRDMRRTVHGEGTRGDDHRPILSRRGGRQTMSTTERSRQLQSRR